MSSYFYYPYFKKGNFPHVGFRSFLILMERKISDTVANAYLSSEISPGIEFMALPFPCSCFHDWYPHLSSPIRLHPHLWFLGFLPVSYWAVGTSCSLSSSTLTPVGIPSTSVSTGNPVFLLCILREQSSAVPVAKSIFHKLFNFFKRIDIGI